MFCPRAFGRVFEAVFWKKGTLEVWLTGIATVRVDELLLTALVFGVMSLDVPQYFLWTRAKRSPCGQGCVFKLVALSLEDPSQNARVSDFFRFRSQWPEFVFDTGCNEAKNEFDLTYVDEQEVMVFEEPSALEKGFH